MQRLQVNVQETVWYDGHWWDVVKRVNYWLTIQRTERSGILGKRVITKKVRPTKVF